MANYEITVLPNEALRNGEHLRLERDPNNAYDKTAVAVYRDKDLVGYVATGANTTLPNCHPASDLFRRMGNKQLGEAWVTLKEETSVPTSTGGKMRAFRGECSFIPVFEQKEAEKIRLIVGGSLINNPLRSNVMADLMIATGKKQALPTFYVKSRTKSNNGIEYAVVRKPTDDISNDSVGIVLNPSDELKQVINKNGSIAFQAIGVCDKTGTDLDIPDVDTLSGDARKKVEEDFKDIKNKCFYGEYSVESGTSTALQEAIKKVVREGRDKYSDVERKVKYMTGEGVPDEIIIATLSHIQPPDPEWESLVPDPKALFRQHDNYGELSRCLAYRSCGMSLRLVGNKGSGKNTLIDTIDWILRRPQYRMEGNAEMDKMDLLGSPQLNDASTTFKVSDMILCLVAGGDVVLDEGNTIRPEVASLLHSLTDESRQIQIPGYGLVTRHAFSTLTLTMNENYMGTTKMNEATVDRFTPIQMAQPASIADILEEAVPTADKKDVKIADKIYLQLKNKISGSNAQGTLEPDCMTIRGFVDALRAAPLLGLKNALMDNVADKPQDEFSRTEIRELILAQCS